MYMYIIFQPMVVGGPGIMICEYIQNFWKFVNMNHMNAYHFLRNPSFFSETTEAPNWQHLTFISKQSNVFPPQQFSPISLRTKCVRVPVSTETNEILSLSGEPGKWNRPDRFPRLLFVANVAICMLIRANDDDGHCRIVTSRPLYGAPSWKRSELCVRFLRSAPMCNAVLELFVLWHVSPGVDVDTGI